MVTLVVQLLPVNRLGRLIFDVQEDECTTDMAASKALRQLAEEEHKDIYIDQHRLTVPFIHLPNIVLHFSVALPIYYPGAIPSPPPDILL